MKVLITGAFGATEEDCSLFASMGLDISLHADERTPVDRPERFEVVVCNGLFQYNRIEEFTALRYIQLTSAGMDRVPIDYIRRHGITVCNAAGVYSIPMAEWTVMSLLELYKNSGFCYENKREHRWEKYRNCWELSGKTVCIIGFGAYGRETAKRLKAFGVEIRVVNRTEKVSPYVDEWYSMECLAEAIAHADVIILAVALTEETRNLIGKAEFDQMKNGAVLVNAARGALVDQTALLQALQSGKLFGTALDVFEREPLDEHDPLWDMKNVVLSPHNSFSSVKNHSRLVEHVCQNIREWMK